MRVLITFKSQFMEEDQLDLRGGDLQEIKEKYINWWKRYGKNEAEAMDAVICSEEITQAS